MPPILTAYPRANLSMQSSDSIAHTTVSPANGGRKSGLRREGAVVFSPIPHDNNPGSQLSLAGGKEVESPLSSPLGRFGYLSGLGKRYILSHNPYHHHAIHLALRPRNSDLPKSVWFTERPLPFSLQVNARPGVYRELNTQTGITIPTFKPLPCQATLWSKADSWSSEAGLTQSEFLQMCVQCVDCERYMCKQISYFHRCAAVTSLQPNLLTASMSGHPVRDVASLTRHFHIEMGEKLGITPNEFEYLFVKCTFCEKIMTRSAAWYHDHEEDVD